MKIGIFTITDALNYGAYFQMYAMYKHLVDLGHDVTVYDCNRSLKLKIIKNVSVNPKRHVFKRKLIKNYGSDWKKVVIKKYKGEKLDFAFLGSDEIWNLDNNHFYHAPEFFGIGVNSKIKVAYAPSVGFGNIDSIKYSENLKDAIRKIDYLYPRDSQTKNLIESCNAIGSNGAVVESVDPTIVYNNWSDYRTEKKKKAQIVYYSYDKNPPFKKELLDFAHQNGLKVISAGFQNEWADESSYLGPFDFLRLISESEYVITTTFHGTIMSALLDCNFVCIPNGQKALNLVRKFGLEEHVYSESENLAAKLLSVVNMSSSYKFNELSDKFKGEIEKILNSPTS